MRYWFALTFAAVACPAPAAEKDAVPSAAEQATARADVRRTLWRDHDKMRTAPATALALADKLSVAADESTRPPVRFVLWTEAAVAAVWGGDIDRAVRAVRRLDRHFRDPDPTALLAAAFVEGLGCHDRRPEYHCLAEAELSDDTPDDPTRLPGQWKRAGEWIPSDQKGVAFRRGRQLAAAALADKRVKGLDRLKLTELHRDLTAGVDEVDAKAGRFTLFEGRWRVRVGEQDSREWVVAADGRLTGDGADGAKRGSGLRLVRRHGAVVVMGDDKQVVEGWKLTGDELAVKRYDPADPKAKPTAGAGTRVSEARLVSKSAER